jgi:hypothetical protein
VCQQSVGLLQRAIDEAGIPAVSATLCEGITRQVKPSLACFVRRPFGLTLGPPGDDAAHREILDMMLAASEGDYPAGTILDLGFRFPDDDLRARQIASYASRDLEDLVI